MDFTGTTAMDRLAAANPLFALWAMPYKIAEAWFAPFLRATKPDGWESAEMDHSQLPVPQPIQENKDRDIFA
ncbi:hypothetical protein C1T17_16920 [Sphingobium sp. SCG-1]|uniref:hypothetical protein n=1 Tax=Sphingobium sp. SCG-1 TaxID=2072936 RepID=UPI000CD698E0|nr:hypothetical protein [Sphingobium sp. SCG-1]AUW59509.1 hypothetical protein C1T17_16920 [Sphingobium sp. SCG-1]